MDEATESWEQSYERLAPKLVLFARQWLPSREDAEDAVHDAFVRTWRRQNRGSLNDAYFFTATRNTAIDHLRRHSRRTAREDRATRDPLFDPVSAPPILSGQDVESALGFLPPEQREVVVLRIWGGLAFAEIAQVTATSPNTAASRYRYAIDRLRQYLSAPAIP